MFDTCAAALGLVLLAPLLLCIAVLIRLTSPGPAVFRQTRVGVHGKDFTIFKFRTMCRDAAGSQRSQLTDQRITRLGHVLRRHKLDELPQLVNVLAGHMCLVGPRPKLRDHHSVDWQLRPGVTGAASVAFAAEERLLCDVAEQDLEECHRLLINPRKTEIDLRYAAAATFRSDLRLLLMTVLRAGRYSHLSQIGEWRSNAARSLPAAIPALHAPGYGRRPAGGPVLADHRPLWESGPVAGALYKAIGTRGAE